MILPTDFISLRTFTWAFSFIQVWFADQNYHPLKAGDGIDLSSDKMKYSVEQRERKYPIKLVIQLNQFNSTDCMFLSCHVRVSVNLHSIFAWMSRNSLLNTW